jgi:quercetin dioxygenase-like cupin family protein
LEDEMRWLGYGLTLLAGVAIGAGGTALHAQQGIKRIPLQKVALSDAPGKDAVLGIAEVPAGMAAGRHSHFGYELGYVLEGAALMQIEGEPPRELKAGDSYAIPAGKIHDAKALGDGAKVIAVYIVDQGKPLATPAP